MTDIADESRAFSVDEIIADNEAADDAALGVLYETTEDVPHVPAEISDHEVLENTWEQLRVTLDFTTARIAQMVREREENQLIITELRAARSDLERMVRIVESQ